MGKCIDQSHAKGQSSFKPIPPTPAKFRFFSFQRQRGLDSNNIAQLVPTCLLGDFYHLLLDIVTSRQLSSRCPLQPQHAVSCANRDCSFANSTNDRAFDKLPPQSKLPRKPKKLLNKPRNQLQVLFRKLNKVFHVLLHRPVQLLAMLPLQLVMR